MRELRESYDRAAATYGLEWGPALSRLAARLIDAMPLEGCARVLDAGCGCGTLLATLGRAAPGAGVLGIDLSHGMLRRAPEGDAVVAGDLRRTPFPAGTFDAVVCAFVLFHVPRPADALAEFARILGPGGLLGTATWSGEPDFPAHRVWIDELLRAGPTPQRPTADHVALDTPDKLRGLYRHAGFAPPAVERRSLDFAFTPESLIALRSTMGCSGRRFASLEPARQAAVLDAVRARLAGLPREAFVDRNEALLAWARRADVG